MSIAIHMFQKWALRRGDKVCEVGGWLDTTVVAKMRRHVKTLADFDGVEDMSLDGDIQAYGINACNKHRGNM